MNVNFNTWTTYNNPYYSVQTARQTLSSNQNSSDSQVAGDTLNISSDCKRLQAAAMQSSQTNDPSTDQQGNNNAKTSPPPPPMDDAQMLQRVENLQNAYDQVSALDAENMSSEEIKTALAQLADTLTASVSNTSSNSVGSSTSVELDSMSDDELRGTLTQLKQEITSQYEQIQEFSSQGGNSGMKMGRGGPPPGGPPPGPPPGQMSQETESLTAAYELISEMDLENISDDELQTAMEIILETLEEESSTESSSDISNAAVSTASSSADVVSSGEEKVTAFDTSDLRSFMNELKTKITEDYQKIMQTAENQADIKDDTSSDRQGYGLGLENRMNSDQSRGIVNANKQMPQFRIDSVSKELFSALFNTDENDLTTNYADTI